MGEGGFCEPTFCLAVIYSFFVASEEFKTLLQGIEKIDMPVTSDVTLQTPELTI